MLLRVKCGRRIEWGWVGNGRLVNLLSTQMISLLPGKDTKRKHLFSSYLALFCCCCCNAIIILIRIEKGSKEGCKIWGRIRRSTSWLDHSHNSSTFQLCYKSTSWFAAKKSSSSSSAYIVLGQLSWSRRRRWRWRSKFLWSDRNLW